MKLIDINAMFAAICRPRCEYCGKRVPAGCHPNHLMGRGFGGGSRIDHPWNLVSLCPDCHFTHHQSWRPSRAELVEVVARREGVTPEEVATEIYRIRALPKGSEV